MKEFLKELLLIILIGFIVYIGIDYFGKKFFTTVKVEEKIKLVNNELTFNEHIEKAIEKTDDKFVKIILYTLQGAIIDNKTQELAYICVMYSKKKSDMDEQSKKDDKIRKRMKP